MKTLKIALATTFAATPALAHTDSAFHTHGGEVFLIVAGVAAVALLAYRHKG